MTAVMSSVAPYAVAYAISTIVGFGVIGLLLKLMRWTVNIDDRSFGWLTFWVSGTERAAAMTLAFLAPKLLPAFIGGWIALKFAAGWQREPNTTDDVVFPEVY
jgi:hypothetical protein